MKDERHLKNAELSTKEKEGFFYALWCLLSCCVVLLLTCTVYIDYHAVVIFSLRKEWKKRQGEK